MPYYRPRMVATLAVPVLGTRAQRIGQERSNEVLQLTVHPRAIRLDRNDHNHADELTLTADWTEAGVDPRLIDNAVVQLHVADADELGQWTPSPANCRFIGLAKQPRASRKVDTAPTSTIVAVDYTTLFLEAKPFGSAGIPNYSMTLDEAWRRIVSQTPGAEALADGLVLEGIIETPRLGDAVAQRFRSLGKVPAKPGGCAWDVWQQCVGMLGLISYVHLDRCIVTTATNFWTADDPPALIWGRNLVSWEESRECAAAGKGVGVTSFDVESGRTLEAVYPPPEDPKVKRKRVDAGKIAGNIPASHREERDWYSLEGITDEPTLQHTAQRIYEESSRQELEGSVVTKEMAVETLRGEVFDLLDLKAGDNIQISVDSRDRELLANLDSEEAQQDYLVNRGYTPDVATLIVANLSNLRSLSTVHYVRNVSIDLEITRDGGSFSVSVSYVNRIVLSEPEGAHEQQHQ